MTYKGHVENGVVVADQPIGLPDGTSVEIRPLRPAHGRHHPDVERFAGIIPQNSGDEEEYFAHIRAKHA